jgi:hypothetical protein
MMDRTQALGLVTKIQMMNRQIAAPGATTAVQVRTKTIMTIVTTAAVATIIVAAASTLTAAVARMKTVGPMTTVATTIVVVVKMRAAAVAVTPGGGGDSSGSGVETIDERNERRRPAPLVLELVRCYEIVYIASTSVTTLASHRDVSDLPPGEVG